MLGIGLLSSHRLQMLQEEGIQYDGGQDPDLGIDWGRLPGGRDI